MSDVPPYGDALGLLRALSGPHGIRASLSTHANYGAVFTRDAVMAGIAGLCVNDETVNRGLVATLEHLRGLQGTEGQIASSYVLRRDAPAQVSFGTLVPRIDAPLWYLIGIGLAARAHVIDPSAFQPSVERTVRMLDTLEYNGRHLINIPAGGDWADEYIYDGYILHDQALRAWALRIVGTLYNRDEWMEKAAAIRETIARSYWPAGEQRRFPLAAFSPTRAFDIFDLATCSLLGASGTAPERMSVTLDWICHHFLAQRRLPPVFHPVIKPGDADWAALSRYHLHGFRNQPHEYHNGGIWMIWLGWLAVAFARANRTADVRRISALVRDAHAANHGWRFEEFFHGITSAPMGTPHMAYSATGTIFLDLASSTASFALLDP